MNNINQAYKSALDAYKLPMMLYDSEINEDWVDMQAMMASMKANLHQFDTAKTLSQNEEDEKKNYLISSHKDLISLLS